MSSRDNYLKYVDLNFKPSKEHLICNFRLENDPAQFTLKECAGGVASESSTGTWTDLSTTMAYMQRLNAKVFRINGNNISIAYEPDLFELGSIPNILSSIAGNVFGLGGVKNLRLEDCYFPKSIVRSFKGPKFGIDGVRKKLKLKKRPIVGTVIKPKLGLNVKDHVNFGLRAFLGGCDFVKDDENLSSQKFNNFYKRAELSLNAADKAKSVTGEEKVVFLNVTAETKEMMKRAEFVQKLGGKYVMIDILTNGWASVQTLREMNLNCIIHAHRAQHAALDRNPLHGISMLFIAKLARLGGVDQLHVGTAVGKMSDNKKQVLEHINALKEPMFGLKPILPVASGGLHPGHMPELLKIFGNDCCIQAGGGIHGHPQGTLKGAMAVRQAIDAALKKIPLKEYAENHMELAVALKKWA